MASGGFKNQKVYNSKEIKERLHNVAEKGVQILEKVKENRDVIKKTYEQINDILASAQDTIQILLDGLQIDTEFDEYLLSELERARGDLDMTSESELKEQYTTLNTYVTGSLPVLKETTPMAKRCRNLVDQIATIDILGSNARCTVNLNCISADGNLGNALLAASIVSHRLNIFKLSANMLDAANSEKHSEKLNGAVVKAAPSESFSAVLQKMDDPPAADAASGGAQAGLTNGQQNKSTKTEGCTVGVQSKQGKTDKGDISGKRENVKGSEKSNSTQVANINSNQQVKPKEQVNSNTTQNLMSTRPRVSTSQTIYFMIIDTGDVHQRVLLELKPQLAPKMCRNFMKLCDDGMYNNTFFHFANADDQLLGGRVDAIGSVSAFPEPGRGDGLMYADPSPLPDQFGALRMKGICTEYMDGIPRCLVGSQFMFWLSKTRDYHSYERTLVFGQVLEGVECLIELSNVRRFNLPSVTILLAGKFGD